MTGRFPGGADRSALVRSVVAAHAHAAVLRHQSAVLVRTARGLRSTTVPVVVVPPEHLRPPASDRAVTVDGSTTCRRCGRVMHLDAEEIATGRLNPICYPCDVRRPRR